MRNTPKKTISAVIIFLIIGVYLAVCVVGTVAPVKAEVNPDITAPHSTSSLIVWPSEGESAVGVLGTSILNTHGVQTPMPTASTAKMITALMVLKAKPLSPGQQGPEITLTANDANIYNSYVAEQGSVVAVRAGEQISEYQMLECMLLPSANNIADSLAVWSYGSLNAYSSAANAYLNSLGLGRTRVGPDASGFNPATVSTAEDLVKIGEMVMGNPVLSQIVGQPTATGIPVVGTIKNVNYLLGTSSIVGIKTGNNDQDKGAFVGAGTDVVNGKTQVVVTASLGASSLAQAVSGSLPFIKSAESNFIPVTLVPAGGEVAAYSLPWSNTAIPAHASSNLIAYVWGGTSAQLGKLNLKNAYVSDKAGREVGSVQGTGNGLIAGSGALVQLGAPVPGPSLAWKITHPGSLRF